MDYQGIIDNFVIKCYTEYNILSLINREVIKC